MRKPIVLEILAFFSVALLGLSTVRPDSSKPDSRDVTIQKDGLGERQAELSTRITSAPSSLMQQSGLAGALGEIHVKVTSNDAQEVVIPLPQLADNQVPICTFINSAPAAALTELQLRKRDADNVVVVVRLAGKPGDVKIAWSAVVLLASQTASPNTTPVDDYRSATPCVQSQDDKITKLSADLWPTTGKAADFAMAIQQHIREMQRISQPRSLDALGILRSGFNGICTANANLAAAVMRSKGIACRSIAVVPPLSQRLEMHRIVEYYDNGGWQAFDPSSLQIEIPAKPWQNIIMAKTTIQDEQQSMKPRMGAMFGCPYAQEAELLTPGVLLNQTDFFWTTAKPLAEFETSDEAVGLAKGAWNHYLETGTLSEGQLKAASARSLTELVDDLKADKPAPQAQAPSDREKHDEVIHSAQQTEILGYILGGAGILVVVASIPFAIWWDRKRKALGRGGH